MKPFGKLLRFKDETSKLATLLDITELPTSTRTRPKTNEPWINAIDIATFG